MSSKNAAAYIPQNKRSGIKCAITEEKKNKSDKSYIRGTLSDKVAPAIDFTNNPVIQCECDVPVIKNTFADDGDMQMIVNKF